MKRSSLTLLFSALIGLSAVAAEEEIHIQKDLAGRTKPIWVSLSGFTGEAAQVLQFDLYVQGFNFTNADGAQYLLSGSNNGELQGRAVDAFNKHTLVSKAYQGGTLRRQAHLFVDEFCEALQRKPICQTKIAFKGENGQISEVYLSDFDGHNGQAVTRDSSIVAAPAMVSGQLALYYTSYKLDHPDIFFQNLSTGARKIFARYGGSNISPAPSPDGSQVAMILSKDGWTDLYVANSDGSNLRRLTKSPQD
jgi:TolB protein